MNTTGDIRYQLGITGLMRRAAGDHGESSWAGSGLLMQTHKGMPSHRSQASQIIAEARNGTATIMEIPGTDGQFANNITPDNLFDVHWDIFGFGGSPSEWAQPFLPVSESSSRGNGVEAQSGDGGQHDQANNAATIAKLRKRRGKTATVR